MQLKLVDIYCLREGEEENARNIRVLKRCLTYSSIRSVELKLFKNIILINQKEENALSIVLSMIN